MSSDFTLARCQENSRLSKPLNQRDFIEPGTHLAATRDKNVRMAQPRLRDINEIDPRSILSLYEKH
jgi:hypothetical protein